MGGIIAHERGLANVGERVKGAPKARAAGIVTLDARVLATILVCRVGGQAKGWPPTSRGKGVRPR